jgi:hypothetical protein
MPAVPHQHATQRKAADGQQTTLVRGGEGCSETVDVRDGEPPGVPALSWAFTPIRHSLLASALPPRQSGTDRGKADREPAITGGLVNHQQARRSPTLLTRWVRDAGGQRWEPDGGWPRRGGKQLDVGVRQHPASAERCGAGGRARPPRQAGCPACGRSCRAEDHPLALCVGWGPGKASSRALPPSTWEARGVPSGPVSSWSFARMCLRSDGGSGA